MFWRLDPSGPLTRNAQLRAGIRLPGYPRPCAQRNDGVLAEVGRTGSELGQREETPVAPATPSRGTDPRCGTQAGFQAHRAAGTQACEACYEADRVYRRAYERATSRALWRLARLHKTEYRRLVAEERGLVKAGEA